MTYVLDASVAVRWFLDGNDQRTVDAVLERLLAEPEQFAMPELFFYEVFAVLARTRDDHLSVYVDGFLPMVEYEAAPAAVSANLEARTQQFPDVRARLPARAARKLSTLPVGF